MLKSLNSKKLLIFIIIFLIIFVVLYNGNSQKETNSVCINNNCFNVDLAQTLLERQKGLSNVPFLPENKGMLFIFPEEGIYPFWMKDTLISLDIIWISSENKIIHIEKNLQPCSENICLTFSSETNALYVLEINAGLSDKFRFEIGDLVKIK